MQPWMASSREPVDFETDLAALTLDGNLPEGLEGLLLRNGPNAVVPDAELSWFAGDGMLHAFYIHAGRIDYSNRWIRTNRWENAKRTGCNAKPGSHDDGYANTNIISHAGHMLALEEAHLPVRVDPATLGTLGVNDFAGQLSGAFTAHPKSCPVTGELLFFGYGTPERLTAGMQFGIIDREGRVSRVEHFDAPYASMMHDFAVTEHHVVLPVMPLTASRRRAAMGGPAYAWEPEFGTRVGIMRRGGSVAEIVWYTGPACYVYHVVNAWESGTELFVDVLQYDEAPMFPTPDGHYSPTAYDGIGQLVRWRFDLSCAGGTFDRTAPRGAPGEFPRIDERRSGLPYRHAWYVGTVPAESGGWRARAALVHADQECAGDDIYISRPGESLSEPVFVPRSETEGDGWILATACRPAAQASQLLIFDAQALAAGPVCTAHVPHRIPDGFHGQWFPGVFR